MENNRPDHAVSTNIKKTNKVNSIVDNEMKFDSINSLDNKPVKELPQILNIRHRGGKNYIQSIILGGGVLLFQTFLCMSSAYSSIPILKRFWVSFLI